MKDKKDTSGNIIFVITIIVFLCILLYMTYNLYISNKELNSNAAIDLKVDTENYNDKNIKNDNATNIEKEIEYKETEIASFTSTLYDNSENRIFNINKACGILNGTVVKKGEEFSFNNTIGPMGVENGYKLATGFDSNGKNIKVPAGGMCQVSSTLYNVCLLSGLQVTERHPHSKRVYYVPKDKDATVYYPTLDLKFINNTENDIKITAQTDNYNVTIKMYKIEQSN